MIRTHRLKDALHAMDSNVDAMLVTHLPDVRYLTGFTGSNAALVVPVSRPGSAILYTDGRYIEQARQEAHHVRVVIAKGSALREACAWMEHYAIHHCAFDAEHTTVAALDVMRQAISSRARRGFFVPAAAPVACLRQTKDPDEIRRLQAAAALGCALYENMLKTIAPGRTEIEVATELESVARIAGADGMSFDTIVASGKRSALPHGRASMQRLPRRGFVVLDFGVTLNGYCSDMTRTVHLGAATRQERFAYDAVLEAQTAAVEAVRSGVCCGDVDEAARSVLRRAKLAKYFTHSTGHGVGLEIHEGPRIAAEQKQTLKAGMVVTIEPGVYLARRFGIRIEDMVLVTRRGARVLTAQAPKEWAQI